MFAGFIHSILISLLAVGAFGQESAMSATAPQAPGQMVDLGGYKLHVWCMGKGTPAVVLSPGAGDFSFAWALVQPKIAASTRVCSYDRAGEAWSDLGPQPRTMRQEAFDLHRALAKAGVPGPYIVVGHSMGGLIVREFAAMFPDDVAGMVLVDSAGDDALMFINGKLQKPRELAQGRSIPAPRRSITASDALTPEYVAGMKKFIQDNDIHPEIDPPFMKLPPEMQKWQLWALGEIKHFAALENPLNFEENQELYEARTKTPFPLGNLPLIVLRRNMYDYPKQYAELLEKQHKELQEELAHLSRQGDLIVVPNTGHHIHLEAPKAVIDAIQKVMARAANQKQAKQGKNEAGQATLLNAVAAEHVSFSTEDGGVIFGDVYGNGDRGVVLAHGGRFNKESWAKQARQLAAAGFRVLSIDFRGYGKSTGPGDKNPMSAPLHLDVLAAVRYMHKMGAKTVSVVGGSMGGAAAGDASIASEPGEIHRVVLLGAAPNGPAEKLKSPALFIVAHDDAGGSGPRLPGIRAQYEKAPKPKKLIVLRGSAHAQYLFQTDQGERVMREIVRFLSVR